MATRKAASSTKTKKTTTSRSRSTTKAAPRKTKSTTTNVTRVSAKAAPSRNVAAGTGTTTARRLDSNTINIVLAEIVGTFVLTLVALLTFQNFMPLYIGLTLVLLVFTIGAVSGSHVNPAVTFGLWVAGKLKPLLVPFYWGAQFLGAMAAFLLLNAVSNNSLGLNFGHFNEFSWGVFSVELVGTAVFLLGLVAAVSRVDLSATGKALGIGLSLMAGLLVAGSLFSSVQAGVDQTQIGFEQDEEAGTQRLTNVPHELRVKGAILNPAIALVTTESTDSELQSGQVREGETSYSRLGLETILSTLVGAALGAGVARLLNHRFDI